MDTGRTSWPSARVVIVSPSSGEPLADLGTLREGLEIVRVSGAYEAAAEILAGPVAALVIDSRVLTRRCDRLLAMARAREVEVLACGPLRADLDVEAISGVRLVAGRDLPAMLNGLAAPAPQAPPVEPPPVPAVRPAPSGKKPVKLGGPAPADAGASKQAPGPDATGPSPDPPSRSEDADASGVAPGRLLSADELAALLENEQ